MVSNALLAIMPLMLITSGVVGGLEVEELPSTATRSTTPGATITHEAFSAVRLNPPGWVLPRRKLLQNSAGQCGPSAHCQNGLCCSSQSYCGSSPVYCGDGCQPLFGTCGNTSVTAAAPVPQGTAISGGACGPGPGLSCTATECCSTYGFCGKDEAHCGVGCQPSYGTCNGTGTNTSVTPTPARSPGPVPPSAARAGKGSSWSTVTTVGTVVGAFIGLLAL